MVMFPAFPCSEAENIPAAASVSVPIVSIVPPVLSIVISPPSPPPVFDSTLSVLISPKALIIISPAFPASPTVSISAVIVTAPSVLSILILPLLPLFISVCVVPVVLLFVESPTSGSPAEEKTSPVVILPLLVMLILPPSPRRENDSIVPALVSIIPSAVRVISPPLPFAL